MIPYDFLLGQPGKGAGSEGGRKARPIWKSHHRLASMVEIVHQIPEEAILAMDKLAAEGTGAERQTVTAEDEN